MKQLVLINNTILPEKEAFLSATDESVLFGWGVFETMRLYNSRIFLLNEHMKRFIHSCTVLQIPFQLSKQKFNRLLNQYIQTEKLTNCLIRVTILKGEKNTPATILCTNRNISYTQINYNLGFTATISSIRRNPTSLLAYHKTTSYLENIISKQDAVQKGYQEAIFLNTKNKLAEGSMSNIFFIKQNTIYTPNIACGLLPGIIRNFILTKLAPSLRIPVHEGTYSLKKLLEADEAFLTNSAMQIMPLISLNKQLIGSGRAGKLTKKLIQQFNKVLETHKKVFAYDTHCND